MRPGTTSRLMISTLFTALWIPYASCAEAFLEVGHDLLRAHYQDDPPGAAGIWAELAATHRGRDQRSGLGDGMHAAEHDFRRRAQAADVVGLGLAVHAPEPRPEELVATGLFDFLDDAGHLQR